MLERPLESAVADRPHLDGDEPPPLDDGVRAELKEFVDRRRFELGD
jgi:hypothetical protein